MGYTWSSGDALTSARLNKTGFNYLTPTIAGETISGATTPVAVCFDEITGYVHPCDANNFARLTFRGFAVTTASASAAIEVQTAGVVTGLSGLTSGSLYYVNDSAALSTTPGTHKILVGRAMSTTSILILPEDNMTMMERAQFGENKLLFESCDGDWTDVASFNVTNTLQDDLASMSASGGSGSDGGLLAHYASSISGSYSFTNYARYKVSRFALSIGGAGGYTFMGFYWSTTYPSGSDTYVRTSKHIGFFWTAATTLRASVADGTTQNTTTITGITGTSENTYEIYLIAGTAYFYVNDVLKATITTNVPTGAFAANVAGVATWDNGGSGVTQSCTFSRRGSWFVVQTQ